MHASRKTFTLAFTLSLTFTGTFALAQKQVSPADGKIVTADSIAQDQEEPDVKATVPSVDSAWSMLTTATQKQTQTRILALAALGTMGSDARAAGLIREAMTNPELEVRTAAILAAGQSKNRALIPALRERLKDAEPQAVFAAAVTLWKMDDHSGEHFLKAVVDGDRKATPTLMHGAKNDMNKELHDPGAMATLGATTGASILLGPFGFGIEAVKYMVKAGSDPSRVAAIDLLAQSHTPGLDAEFVDALSDKDQGVRAAAAKALGQRHYTAATKQLGDLFSDPKLAVRLFAAAAYINCSHAPTSVHTRG
jgi:HEAT repeat protein